MTSIPIDFEGTLIQAREGESLAAALIGNGVRHLRETRSGAERSVFCGMGVCQECLVTIDGKPNQRACMTKVNKPMQVCRGKGLETLPLAAEAEPVHIQAPPRRPDVLVIGAGPGGLSAAIAARRTGADVVVLDERSQSGGQYFKQLSVSGTGIAPPDKQHARGAALIAQAREAGVEIINDALVWGAFEPGDYGVAINGHTQRWQPRVTIIATGAYERGWHVPGWTLPGVMTTGAAQTLWRTARRLPGKRVLIAGNGPLNLQLGAELIAGGAQVLAVVEAAPAPGLSDLGRLARLFARAPGLVRDGLAYRLKLAKAGTPLINERVVSAVVQHGDGLRVTLRHPGGSAPEQTVEVDCLCLGYGFEPANELLRALGCSHDYHEQKRQLVTRRDADGLTDISGVYALGDCTGLGGALAALAEGTVVGLAAATRVGRPLSISLQEQQHTARKSLQRQREFQRDLWALYHSPARAVAENAPGCLICRCEEVTFATLQTALDEGLGSVGAIKRRTRIGMGRCQGRYCAPLLDETVSALSGQSRSELSGFAPRVPVKPLTIAELAGTLEKSR